MKWVYLSAFLLQNSLLATTPLSWQGTTNSMALPANWSPSGPPTTGDPLTFPTTSTFSKAVQNNIAGGTLTVGNLTINDVYTFTGGTFVFPVVSMPAFTTISYGTTGSNINLGGLTFTGDVKIIGVGASPGNQIQAPISGAGNLDISGAYILLSGNNSSYTGAITLDTGATLKSGSGNAFSSSVNIALGNTGILDVSGVTAGAGFNNTMGLLTGSSGSVLILGNGSLTVTNSGSTSFGGVIEANGPYGGGFILGAGSTGSLTLTGNNTYSSQTHPGETTVNAGTLIAGATNAFGLYSNTTVASGATLNLNNNNITFGTLTGAGTITLGSGTLTCTQGGTFTGSISGTGGLSLTSATLTLNTPAYTGQTQISGGSTLVTNSLGGPSSSLLFLSGGGTVKANSSGFTYNNPITLSANATFNTNGQTITLGGGIGGAGSLTKAGTGILILNGSNGYTGATQVQAGTLRAGSVSALGTASFVSLTSNTAILDLNNNSVSIGSLNGAVGSSVTLGSATLTISEGSVDDAFYGVISGTGNLVASGGTVTMMKSNTFTGSTTIQGGATLNVLDLGDTDALTFLTGGGNLEFGSATSSSAPLTINGPATIGSNTFDITLSGDITGMAGTPFSKIGPGTLTLTGMNNLASQIAIEGGTLNVTANSLNATTEILFNNFSGTLQAGGDFTFANSVVLSYPGTVDTNGHDVEISGPITTNNPFTKAGAGTLTLTGANNYQARTTITGGTLIASATSLPTGSQIVFQGSGASTFKASGAFTPMTSSIVLMADGTIDTNSFNINVTGVVAGLSTNSITKAGMGTLTFSGANLYEGPTLVTVGTLQAGVATVGTTSGAFGVNSAVTISAAATLDLNSYSNTIQSLAGASGSFVTLGTGVLTINNGNSQTFAGNISGTGGGITLTTGTQIFSGTNSYTGPTTVNGGTLQAGSTSAFAPASHFVMASGTTLNLNSFNNTVGSLAGAGTVTLGSATLTVANGNSQTYSGAIGGTGGLTLTTGTLTLSGTNGYTGATTVNSGTLRAGAANAFAAASAHTVAGGATLNLNNFNNTIKSLAGAGTVSLGTATLTLANGSGASFSGGITGTGGITLTTGSQTFTGTNTYSGPTAVNGGTLLAGSTAAFGTSDITVASGATLNFQTNANTVGSVTNSGNVSSSATITAATYTQNSGGTTTLNFPTSSISPVGNFTTTGAINLNGSLVVTNTGMFSPSTSTQVTLFQSSGTGKQLQGTFSSTTVPFGKITYDYSENLVILGASHPSTGCDGDWTSAANGNWATMANWDSCVPGLATADERDTATFSTVAASTVTVTLANTGGTMAQNVTLHDITFDSSSTSYTIANFSGSGTIFLDAPAMSTKPTITVLQGTHTINAAISLEQDVRFTLHSGSLTLGAQSSIISSGVWNVSEGAGSGILYNYGTISPSALFFEGNTIVNHGTMSPSGTFEISGLGGIGSPVNFTNFLTLSSGGAFLIGDADGPTIFTNNGTATSSSTFTIASGTVTNNSGATMTAASSSTFSITGGSVTNNSGATLGASNANLSLTGGTLATSGSVLANNYTQGSSGTLQPNVLSLTSFGKVTVSGTPTLDGTLVVNALPGISLVNGDTLELLTSASARTTRFANVLFQNFPGSLIPSIVYLADGVQLDIREASPAPAHGATISLVFTSIGQHNSFLTLKNFQMRNRMRKGGLPVVASAPNPFDADTLTASNDLEPIADSLAQQINPEGLQKTQQLSDRVSKEKERPWSVYAGPVSSFGKVDSKGNQPGLGYTSAGALIGVDGILDDEEERSSWAGFGAVLEYRRSWGTADDNWGTSSFDRIHGSFYSTLVPKSAPDFAFDAILGFAYNWDTLNRRTGIDQSLTATGKTNEAIIDALIGLEYTFSGQSRSWLPDNFSFTPLATLQFINDWIGGYKETGAGIYDLRVSSHTPQSLSSVLGSRFDYLFKSRSIDTRLEIDLGWQYEYLNRSAIIGLNAFNSTAVPTSITTVAPGRNSFLASFDLLLTTAEGYQVEANASYQLNSLFYDLFFYLGFGRQF